MDGKDALRRLQEVLDEESTGTWLDTRTSYDYLWEAATEYTNRTGCLTSEQRIVTVAHQPNYTLNYDFLRLYQKDSSNRFYVKFNDSIADTFIPYKDYESIYYNDAEHIVDLNQSTTGLTTATGSMTDDLQDFGDWDTTAGNAQYQLRIYDDDGRESYAYLGESTGATVCQIHSVKQVTGALGWEAGSATGTCIGYEVRHLTNQNVPDGFAIRDKQALHDQITGSCTTAADETNNESNLIDSAGLFLTTDYVSPGDIIHNTTDASDGMVLSIIDANTIKVALYGGTDNEWDETTAGADAYVIQPQGRVEIFFDPPPATSNHLIRIPYVCRPAPVYTAYGTYRFQQKAMEAIIKYAAWLYKYRDAEPNFGDRLFIMWDREVRAEALRLNPYLNQRKWTVNLKARR